MKASGKCLCGSVELKVDVTSTETSVCHCSMCRNWSGAPAMAVDCGQSVEISDNTSVSRYASSEWAERGFCKNCGTHLFYYLKPNDQYYVQACLLNIQDQYTFTHQIFIDEKPEFYSFANDTTNMTGAELMAQFGGEE